LSGVRPLMVMKRKLSVLESLFRIYILVIKAGVMGRFVLCP